MSDLTDKHIRVFISHHSSQKSSASHLKSALEAIGCTGFVAHEDIEPTHAWLTVIQDRLNSMDVLVGLVDEKFNSSVWCQQEVGWALGRQIPVYCIALHDHASSTGFAGQTQDFKRVGKTSDERLANFIDQLTHKLISNPHHNRILRKFFINKLSLSSSFARTNTVISKLRLFSDYDDEDRASVISTYNANHQVRHCRYAQSTLADILSISSFKQT